MEKNNLNVIANQLRIDTLTAINKAGSGHTGGSLSCVEIITALYFNKMNIDPKNPLWENRDRFIMSKGHSCPILYAALAKKGFFSKDDLYTLRQIDSHLQGHPDMKKTPGIDMSTGSLGQGISAAVGIALGGKLNNKNYKVYCLTGCGENQEGQLWEAVMSAGNFKLNNLVNIVDYNNLQIDGTNKEIMDISNITQKYLANKWNVIEIDGHNIEEILNALNESDNSESKPTAIIAKTIKGKGVSFIENNINWHGKAPNDEEYIKALKELRGEKNVSK